MARYVVDIGENVLVVEYCPVSDTVDDIKDRKSTRLNSSH